MARDEYLFKTCQLVTKLENNLSVSEIIGKREPNYQNNVEAREKYIKYVAISLRLSQLQKLTDVSHFNNWDVPFTPVSPSDS